MRKKSQKDWRIDYGTNIYERKKILPLVLSMSLPMVISMAVNSLYNIVDSYFVAKLNEEAMTALSLVYPIQNMINAIAIGFAIGINASVAFYLGAGDQERADKAATQGMLFKRHPWSRVNDNIHCDHAGFFENVFVR